MAEFELREKSPLPAAFAPPDHPGGQTQVFNVRRIKRINHHLAESEEQCPPDSISDTENWRNWNGDLVNLNVDEVNRVAKIESHSQLDHVIEGPEIPEHRDISAAPHFPRLIRLTWRSM